MPRKLKTPVTERAEWITEDDFVAIYRYSRESLFRILRKAAQMGQPIGVVEPLAAVGPDDIDDSRSRRFSKRDLDAYFNSRRIPA